MEKQTIRIHRVGSVTFGLLLVLTGILFLIRAFFPRLDYEVVFHFWPLVRYGISAGSYWKKIKWFTMRRRLC